MNYSSFLRLLTGLLLLTIVPGVFANTSGADESINAYGEDIIADGDLVEEPPLSPQEIEKQYSLARMAFLFGQYKLAYKLWFPLAENGYANAQATIGWMYHTGKGVNQNYKQAYFWYSKAAKQGHAIAQNNIGVFYEQGLAGLRKNSRKAAHWYQESAEVGYSYAQYNLGNLYKDGKGVKKNKNEAIYWLQIAALQGVKQAQDTLDSLGNKAAKQNSQNHKIPKHQGPLWDNESKKPPKHNFAKLKSEITSTQKNSPSSSKKLIKFEKVDKSSWVLKQNPKNYTIQMASSEKLDKILSLLDYDKINKNSAYFKSILNGKTYYILIYGTYPDVRSAKNDISKIPSSLRKWSPWVRQFSEVQARINNNSDSEIQ